jgi:cytochrome c peroxidase
MRRILCLLAIAGLSTHLIAQGPPPPPPPLPPLLPPPIPTGDPVTAAKTNLGKVLFWEEQVSASGTTACGTCHVFEHGGSDARTSATNPAAHNPGVDGVFGNGDDVFGSPGVRRRASDGSYTSTTSFGIQPQVTPRKAPSVINAAYATSLFWDGRATPTFSDPVTGNIVVAQGAALESQAAGPPVSDVEMGHVGTDWTQVAARLATATPLRLSPQVPAQLTTWIAGRDYPALFQEAFGTNAVTPSRIIMAIATYERALFSNQAPVDQFVQGQPPPLTQQELQGLQIFNEVGRCRVCHVGPRFTNDTFQYIGVRPQADDLGRFGVTNNPGDRGRMKVPSLRNVEMRAPYFHNGEMATLEDVVDFYDRGGDFDAPNKNPAIAPIGLSPTEKAALVAFLRRPLTDPRIPAAAAPFDRPALYSESSRVATHYGTGTSGSGDFVPRIAADEPLCTGNGQLTIGVDRGNGGRGSILAIAHATNPGGTPYFGATVLVPFGGLMLVRHGPLSGSGPGNGFGSATLAIPDDPVLIGTTFAAQWFVLDSTPGKRFAASDAVTATYF